MGRLPYIHSHGSMKLKREHKHNLMGMLPAGTEIKVEDWWENVSGGSWMDAVGNPACIAYAMRTGLMKDPPPIDNEVLYGKIGHLGVLVHVSEVEELSV